MIHASSRDSQVFKILLILPSNNQSIVEYNYRMTNIQYSIADEIFERFPEFLRGVVIAKAVVNRASPPELVRLLREAEVSLREQLNSETLITHPRIISWREAFRSLGIKPSEYRPSLEAMARRVINGNELPSINALVDIGNIISLRRLLPVGGHSLNEIKQDIALRAASGEEEFIPFGSDQMEHPEKGEFIFAEGDAVLTRRWVWRQSNHSLTELSTTFIEFNLDGLPPVTMAEIIEVCDETKALIQQFCGGELTSQVLTQSSPEIIIDK
jgi:DNA/RNA-binding domain of Phe-tRNA-synthetase-like protein